MTLRAALPIAAVLALLVPVAAPARESFDSRVTIAVKGLSEGTPSDLHGRVRSAKDACERRRKVRVVRRNEGETTIYARDVTDARGRWRVVPEKPVPNGTYRAVAVAKRLAAGRCAKSRSGSIFID